MPKQEAALSAMKGDLADQLVEGLRIKFLSDGENVDLAGLACLQTLVKLILEVDNVLSSC